MIWILISYGVQVFSVSLMAQSVVGAPAPLSRPVDSSKAMDFAAKLHAPLTRRNLYKKKDLIIREIISLE